MTTPHHPYLEFPVSEEEGEEDEEALLDSNPHHSAPFHSLELDVPTDTKSLFDSLLNLGVSFKDTAKAAVATVTNNGEPNLPGWRLAQGFDQHGPEPSNNRHTKAVYNWTNPDTLDVYEYYKRKGFYCILTDRFLRLLAFAFVIWFTTFLVGCIEYGKIHNSTKIEDIMRPQCFSGKRLPNWTFFFLLVAMAVWLGQLFRYLIQIPGLWQLREFYTNLLLIPDEDMQTLQWSTVMHKITHLRAHTQSIINASLSLNLDAHTITNRIMRKENYLIALFNKEMIPLGFCGILTTSLEWNLKFCLFNCLFDKNGQVRPAFVQGATSREQQNHLVKDLCKRFRLMAILNGLFAPFVLLYLLLFFFFRYFKEYQNSPSEMGSRSYTLLARWKLREFNELEHSFEQRLRRSYPKAMLYLDEFPKEKTVMFARFLSFISGSVAGVLALMAIYHQELLLNFHFTQEGTLFFYLGLFGTIFALSRGLVPDENIVFDPKRRLLDVVEDTHYLPDGWRNRLETDQVRQQFNNMFQLKVLGLLYELWGVLWTPFVLWRDLANPRSVEKIMDFFRTFSVHVDGLGYICSFAEFNFERNGNIKYGVPTQLNDAYFVSNEGKMEKSFLNFKATYPDWVPQDATGSMFLSKLQELKPSRNASAPALRGILKRRSDSTAESNPMTKKEPEQLDRMAGMLDTMDLRAMKRHNNFVGSASVHENLNYQRASSSTQTSLSKSVIVNPTTTNQDPLHLEWSTGKLSVTSAVSSGNGYSSDGEESSSSSTTSQDARQNDPGVFSLLNRFYAADELMELQHPPSMH